MNVQVDKLDGNINSTDNYFKKQRNNDNWKSIKAFYRFISIVLTKKNNFNE